ncbi:hypothetical protein KUTeg_015047, partial [Tegillarca granosa]
MGQQIREIVGKQEIDMEEVQIITEVVNPHYVQVGKNNTIDTDLKLSIVNLGAQTLHHSDCTYNKSYIKTSCENCSFASDKKEISMEDVQLVTEVVNPRYVQIGKNNTVGTEIKMSIVNLGAQTLHHRTLTLFQRIFPDFRFFYFCLLCHIYLTIYNNKSSNPKFNKLKYSPIWTVHFYCTC